MSVHVSISDHAVLRYMERVMGVDVSAVRGEMRTAGLDAAIALGAETVKLANGCRLKIVNGAVVTVLPKRLAQKCKTGRPEL